MPPFTCIPQALNPKGLGSFFASKETKFENASELYEKAGIAYKTGKAWKEAGDAFCRLSECYTQLQQNGDAANKMKEVRSLTVVFLCSVSVRGSTNFPACKAHPVRCKCLLKCTPLLPPSLINPRPVFPFLFFVPPSFWQQAGDCYQRVSIHECVAAWRQSTAMYLEAGRWNQCGNVTKAIAEL